MKHKVSDLEGALLDAAVATALGHRWRIDDETICYVKGRLHDLEQESAFCPSMYWDHGGPIIQRERITVNPFRLEDKDAVVWVGICGLVPFAVTDRDGVANDSFEAMSESVSKTRLFAKGRNGSGPTPLIAAMRAFVASKLGDEVDLP